MTWKKNRRDTESLDKALLEPRCSQSVSMGTEMKSKMVPDTHALLTPLVWTRSYCIVIYLVNDIKYGTDDLAH